MPPAVGKKRFGFPSRRAWRGQPERCGTGTGGERSTACCGASGGGSQAGLEQLAQPRGGGTSGRATGHACRAAGRAVSLGPCLLLSSADLSQVEITRAYLARQADEISLQQADVVLVLGGEDGKGRELRPGKVYRR